MKKIISFILGATFPLLAQWVMFADSKDTYIYNTQTGEIYIRYKKNKKNYEDVFVKMPIGQNPNHLNQPLKHPHSQGEDSLYETKMQSLKKSQQMINQALEGSF